MNKEKRLKIIDITSENIDKLGFFCRMSKMKSKGNQQKLSWLKQRFDEGLKIKMLELPERGFIEYIPGEFAWRSTEAKGYMFIHCLWVVGKSKGKGFGNVLLEECISEAKKLKMNGVSALVSDGNWMANKNIFLKNGFEIIDQAEPSFYLIAKKFKKVASPSFVNNWEINKKKYKNGLTIFKTDQCPYLDDAVTGMKDFANENNIPLQIIQLKSAEEVREKSPSAHGTYNIVYNGKLLSSYYLLPKEIKKKIDLIENNK